PGWYVVKDRELSWIPRRAFRRRVELARATASASLRSGAPRRSLGGCDRAAIHGSRRDSGTRDRSRGRQPHFRKGRRTRDRRSVAPVGAWGKRRVLGAGRLLRRGGHGGAESPRPQ